MILSNLELNPDLVMVNNPLALSFLVFLMRNRVSGITIVNFPRFILKNRAGHFHQLRFRHKIS